MVNQYLVHILSSVTDNCPTWISVRKRNGFITNLHERMLCRPEDQNLWPFEYQADAHPIELSGPTKWNFVFGVFDQVWFKTNLLTYRDELKVWNFRFSKYRHYTSQTANNKGADQTAQMHMLICVFIVRIRHKQVFPWHGSKSTYLWCGADSQYLFTSPSGRLYPVEQSCSQAWGGDQQCFTSLKKTIWGTSWQNQQNECAPSKDSDPPGHPPSLNRVFAVRMKKHCALNYLGWSESSLGAHSFCLVLSCGDSFINHCCIIFFEEYTNLP